MRDRRRESERKGGNLGRCRCLPFARRGGRRGRSRRLWLGHAKIWEAQSGNLCGEPVGHRVVCSGGPDGLKECLRPDVLHIRWADAGCRLTPFLHSAEALFLSRPPTRNTSVRAWALQAPTHLCCPRARTTACRRPSIEATVQVRASICSSTAPSSSSCEGAAACSGTICSTPLLSVATDVMRCGLYPLSPPCVQVQTSRKARRNKRPVPSPRNVQSFLARQEVSSRCPSPRRQKKRRDKGARPKKESM